MKLPETIVFATGNPNKLREVQLMFPKEITLLSLKDIAYTNEIEETGSTLNENAHLKASTIAAACEYPVFAEDTGLEVDVLNGEPGVYSARYAGPQRSSEDNIDLLLKSLTGKSDRSAQFRTVATFIDGNSSIEVEGLVRGEILDARTGDDGFGYDPVFRPSGFDRSFAQMTDEEKNLISHRGIAIKRLIKAIIEHYQ